VANIDIGPTVLEAAGIATPRAMDGRSFLGLASGELPADPWRHALLYEYYWEFNFPHTPTTFALRSERYKFIEYHGIWDLDEFYDLQEDPQEQHNLILDPQYKRLVAQYRKDLNDRLIAAKANRVPFNSKRGLGAHYRLKSGSHAADFPPEFYRDN